VEHLRRTGASAENTDGLQMMGAQSEDRGSLPAEVRGSALLEDQSSGSAENRRTCGEQGVTAEDGNTGRKQN